MSQRRPQQYRSGDTSMNTYSSSDQSQQVGSRQYSGYRGGVQQQQVGQQQQQQSFGYGVSHGMGAPVPPANTNQFVPQQQPRQFVPQQQQQSQPQQQPEWFETASYGSQHQGGDTNYTEHQSQPNYHQQQVKYNQQYSLRGGNDDDEDDQPLLEELGVDLPAILHRIKAILTFRYASTDATSLDLGGPIIFMSVFAVCHLLVGKLHFGYILGWMMVGSVLLWFILSSMAASVEVDGVGGPEDNEYRLDLYSCCSIAGYSLLPLVMHAGLSLLFPRRSMFTYLVAVIAVLWATAAAVQLFKLRGQEGLQGKGMVVAYPCALMYTAFALLTLY
jgi:hypothetical protein